MHNYFAIETEARARSHALQQMAAAEARASQAHPAQRWFSRFARTGPGAQARTLPAMPIGALLEMRRVPRPVAC